MGAEGFDPADGVRNGFARIVLISVVDWISQIGRNVFAQMILTGAVTLDPVDKLNCVRPASGKNL